MTDTVTPDGYTVNSDGAWTVNQAVQTRSMAVAEAAAADSITDRSGRYAAYASFSESIELKNIFESCREDEEKALYSLHLFEIIHVRAS